MIYWSHYESPLGGITLTSDGRALTGVWFDGQKYYPDAVVGEAHRQAVLPIFAETAKWLDIYFNGRDPEFTPLLLVQTTAFRKAVWEVLLTIPYGYTMTYGEIGEIIAKQNGLEKMSPQAVGNAVGHNSISLIIPCHRVVGANGSLTGYAGGVEKKAWLLAHEGIDLGAETINSGRV